MGCRKAWATMNIKTSMFNLQYLSHFCMDFYATNTSRSALKDLSNGIQYIFVDYRVFEILLKKTALVDANYQWYRGTVVYKNKKYIPLCISPYIGQIGVGMNNKRGFSRCQIFTYCA